MRVAPPRTIIIVDDDPYFGELLARALAPLLPPRVQVVVEKTPDAALAALAALDHVAIVVADHYLEARMTGVELLRVVHEREPIHHRILMTGYRPHQMPEATYPVVMEAFEKPTWIVATHPLLRAIVQRCLPDAPAAAATVPSPSATFARPDGAP